MNSQTRFDSHRRPIRSIRDGHEHTKNSWTDHDPDIRSRERDFYSVNTRHLPHSEFGFPACITVTVTPSDSPSPPPSPTSIVSLPPSPYIRADQTSPFTLHPMSSSTSMSSSRSVPYRPRSPVSMYVAYGVKPKAPSKLPPRHETKAKAGPKSKNSSISTFSSSSADSRLSYDSSTASSPTQGIHDTGSSRQASLAKPPPFANLRKSLRKKLSTSSYTQTQSSAQDADGSVNASSGNSPPDTPTFAPLSESEIRRRQLAKVTRTLGENIPEALVVGGGSIAIPEEFAGPKLITPAKERPTTSRRASISLSTFARFVAPSSSSSSSSQLSQHSRDSSSTSCDSFDPSINATPTYHRPRPLKLDTLTSYDPRHARPESSILSPIAFSDPPPITPPPGTTDFHLIVAEEDHSTPPANITAISSPSSSNHDDQHYHPHDHPHGQEQAVPDDFFLLHPPRPDTPFMDSGIRAPPDTMHLHVADANDSVARRDRRQGWSGEWNQPDMDFVISKLRSLK